MNTLTLAELHQFLASVALNIAAPERGVGRELSYRPSALRTVVIHFGPDDSSDYVREVVSILLSFDDSWLLMARHGSASQLGDLTTQDDAEALTFASAERHRLCDYLCTREMRLGSVSQDVYVLSEDGNMLVTWDHHTEDEGLQVDLRDVERANELLVALNTLGAEVEVFYTTTPDASR